MVPSAVSIRTISAVANIRRGRSLGCARVLARASSSAGETCPPAATHRKEVVEVAADLGGRLGMGVDPELAQLDRRGGQQLRLDLAADRQLLLDPCRRSAVAGQARVLQASGGL